MSTASTPAPAAPPPGPAPAPAPAGAPEARRPNRFKRLLTIGHAIAAVVFVVVIYQVWGRIFTPGGTGSNVVLGLLVAIAAIYLGATHFGPTFDDLIQPKRKRERKAVRENRELEHEVALLLKRAAKGKEKKLSADGVANIAKAQAALQKALADVDKPAPASDDAIMELELASSSLHQVLQKELGVQKPHVAFLVQAKSLGFAFAIAVALRLFLVAPFQIPSGSMIPTLLIGDHLFVFRAMYGLQSPVGAQPSYLVRWSIPAPGDVIVFEAPPWVPRNAGEDWIKRVIAGPGQTVKRVDQMMYVDGKPYTLLGDAKVMRYMDYEELGGGRGSWSEQQAMYRQEEIPGHGPHDTFVDLQPATGDWPTPSEPRGDYRGLRCSIDAGECTVEDGFVFVMGDNRDHSSDGRFWGAVPVDNVKGKALFIWVSVDGSEESVSAGKFTLPRFRWDRLFDWIQ